MTAPTAPSPASVMRFEVAAYPRLGRLLTGLAVGCSRASVPGMLIAIVGFHVPSLPATVLWWCAWYVILPGGVALALARAARARVSMGDDGLVLVRADVQIEVAWSALAAVEPWRVPLPSAGIDLRLASGRRLGYGVAVRDPSPLLAALAARDVAGARAALAHPTTVWARARYAPRRWTRVLVRYPLFALLVTLPLFNVHQWIAYGGTFGQYYTYGLAAYLQTFALYWSTITVYLLSWAGLWRGLGETVCLLVAAVAPARMARVRRLTERTIDVGYYLGTLALLAVRFAA